jgi:competence protein ComEC
MLKILVLFILGIVLQYYLKFNGFLLLSIWLGLLIFLLVTSIEKSKSFPFQKLIAVQLYALFFFGGMLALGSASPGFYKSYYTTHFLPGDEVIARVSEVNSGQNNFDKAILEIQHVVTGSSIKNVHGTVLAYAEKGAKSLRPDEVIVFKPRLSPIQNKGNPGEFDAVRYWKTKGISDMVFIRNSEFISLKNETYTMPFFDQLRGYLKNELASRLSPEASSLAIALSLGDKGGLSQETRENFSNAGAMHVLAVSGLHVGILLGIVQWIFFQVKLLRRRNTYIIAALMILWFFALLTGLAPSVFRATLMFSVLGIGQLIGKRFFSLNGLLVSAFILLMLDAKMLFDIGFQLSYLALLGITFFFQPISNLFYIKNKWLHKLWEGTALGLAAQIGTIPVSLYYFHQFPNYFILTNLGLIVVSGIALGSVLLFFVLAKIPFLSDIIAQGIELIFMIIKWFVKSIDELPFSVARGFSLTLLEVVLAYFAIGVLIYAYQSQKIKLWYASLVFALICAVNFVHIRQFSEFKTETIVFNASSPLILVKQGGTNSFFHTTEDRQELKKLSFIVSAYEKKFGGVSDYYLIKKHTVMNFKNESTHLLSIENDSISLLISTPQSSYLMPLGNDFINYHGESVICGAWIKNNSSLTPTFEIKKGALRL